MDIKTASQELYSKLRVYEEVVGMGVSHINGIQCIIIYLVKKSDNIFSKIPSMFKGYNVKTEIMGNINLQ